MHTIRNKKMSKMFHLKPFLTLMSLNGTAMIYLMLKLTFGHLHAFMQWKCYCLFLAYMHHFFCGIVFCISRAILTTKELVHTLHHIVIDLKVTKTFYLFIKMIYHSIRLINVCNTILHIYS